MITDQIIELINKSRKGETTLEEEAQLIEWMDSDPNALRYLVKDRDIKALMREFAAYENFNTEEAKEEVWARFQKEKPKRKFKEPN